MNRSQILSACAGLLVSGGLVGADDKVQSPAKRLPPAASGTIEFQRDIRPIFTRACVSCHGVEKQRGGLRLDNGTAALKGSDSGPVIKPGDAERSRILILVAGLDPDLKMPPEERKPLSLEEISRLRAWIQQGAKWPLDGNAAASQTRTSSHWAFQAPRRHALPRVADAKWVRNPIDAFVLARLEGAQVLPSEEAERATLIR